MRTVLIVSLVFVFLFSACGKPKSSVEFKVNTTPWATSKDPWTHTAVVRVNDEQGVPMGTDANIWGDAVRTNLKVNCTIPRGKTVEAEAERMINDSIRVKYGSCEGWIGLIQLDKITPKNP